MSFYTNPAGTAANGQNVYATSSQTASFTASANTIYLVSASSAAITVTLPSSTTFQSIIVKKTDTSANSVTLTGTINAVASSTLVMTKQFQSKQLYADTSGGWTVVTGDADITAVAATSTVTGFLNATGTAKMTVGTTAPTSPATGDIWIDTN